MDDIDIAAVKGSERLAIAAEENRSGLTNITEPSTLNDFVFDFPFCVDAVSGVSHCPYVKKQFDVVKKKKNGSPMNSMRPSSLLPY